MKILCLQETPEFFAQLLKNSLIRMLSKGQFKNQFELIFLKAPFFHPEGGLTWTDPPLRVEDLWEGPSVAAARPALLDNPEILAKSFQLLDQQIFEHSASVLFGFSQGSFVIIEYLRKTQDPRIRKAVCCSGYSFQISESPGPPDVLDIELLNVVHPMDSVVPKSCCYSHARKVEILEHNQKNLTEPSREGHVLPTQAEFMRKICAFWLEN